MLDLTNMTADDLLSYHNELAIHAKATRKTGKFRTKALALKAIAALRMDLGSTRVERIEESLADLAQPSAIGADPNMLEHSTLTEVTGYYKRSKPRRLLEQLHAGFGCDIGFNALLTSWFHHTGYFKATANLTTVVAAFRDYLGLEIALEKKA
jgi:hypothetical protein